jgi:triacylglycerol lipase
MLGAGVLNRSQGLYYDLTRENPGNLLGWLNRQPHPEAVYVSVVHRKDGGVLGMGDMVVPEWSQDLNGVIALRGRARTIYSDEGHGLTSGDGEVLLHILESLRKV